jgi:hypothetical protein
VRIYEKCAGNGKEGGISALFLVRKGDKYFDLAVRKGDKYFVLASWSLPLLYNGHRSYAKISDSREINIISLILTIS